ncbi:MAG: DNA-binding protein [Candidatus Omnitrophica bacterium CG07_land_8_20_14_0_80_42_15]|uniref:DNA-binding protein n=1 Tax=Candidatus Aquitaenariimonas noxiae TaxID=1974741 RepID=A0A2J0KQU5_9BACT|nr:MAG: DNA-binding protein [Candidatus Omnitrophica bacterium CG07_land_8_20_14_0_80_42_15]
MKYTQGKIGRIFVLKFDDGDVLLEKLGAFVKKEKLKAATMIFIGALKKGDLVTGPKKPVIPPLPNKIIFKNAWEVLGIGTIFTNSKGPQIHIHSAMGKKLKTLTGCVRGKTEVFLVIEAVVFELKGVKATKDIDIRTGLNLLRIVS